jgi:hypothetical protein
MREVMELRLREPVLNRVKIADETIRATKKAVPMYGKISGSLSNPSMMVAQVMAIADERDALATRLGLGRDGRLFFTLEQILEGSSRLNSVSLSERSSSITRDTKSTMLSGKPTSLRRFIPTVSSKKKSSISSTVQQSPGKGTSSPKMSFSRR